MNAGTVDGEPRSSEPMAEAVRTRQDRRQRWQTEGEQSVIGFVGQIGILGWIIVAPTLIGIFVGRRLDRAFGTGIVFSAALLISGVALGFWSAWRWMHRQ